MRQSMWIEYFLTALEEGYVNLARAEAQAAIDHGTIGADANLRVAREIVESLEAKLAWARADLRDKLIAEGRKTLPTNR